MDLQEVIDIRSAIYDLMEETVKEMSGQGPKDITVTQEANVSVRGKVPPIFQVQHVVIAPVILNSIKILKTLDQALLRDGKKEIKNVSPVRKQLRQGKKKVAIIELLEQGYSKKEIVEKLDVSKAYVQIIKSALGNKT
jgi:hypothetical protein